MSRFLSTALPAAAVFTGLSIAGSPLWAGDDEGPGPGGHHHGPPPLQIDFTKADTNGDGYLSLTEFSTAVKSALKNGPSGKGGQRPPPPPSDSNDSSDAPPAPPTISDETIAAAFAKGDANSDSKLTSDETKAAVKALADSLRPPKR